MKKVFNTMIDSDERDCLIIDNEQSHSDLFFIEVINYDEETDERYDTMVAITPYQALELAEEIIKSVKVNKM